MLSFNARIDAFHRLGLCLDDLLEEAPRGRWAAEAEETLIRSAQENPWFTREAQLQALAAIRTWLHRDQLEAWTATAPVPQSAGRNVAVIMAGNIPLVNFHDMLAVLISGHKLLGKLSSQDQHWMPLLGRMLATLEPGFTEHIRFTNAIISGFDAVIATGSDNSSRYFEYYFGKYPHIIRHNRSSVALLTGRETEDDLHALGVDIFRYFGLGCRNVSQLLVPAGYDYNPFWLAIESWSAIGDHHKYRNNYDYNKAIFLVNSEPFLDNGFLLLREAEMTGSPVGVMNTATYHTPEEAEAFLLRHAGRIQCIVARERAGAIPFGHSQEPALTDYPDGMDILAFLSNLA